MKWIQRKWVTTPNKKDSIMTKIAKIRGIEEPERFLNPTSDELHDPYLMKNIEEASSRIIYAIEQRQKIVVSFDPDCDGLMSATTAIRYLKKYSDQVDFIYGERGDGHGIKEMIHIKEDVKSERNKLNQENIEKIKNADLLILVDSSTSDTAACQMIQEWGVDIVILDHHGIEQENPHAIIVNPQQTGCEYPNKHLSGAGVVLKTLQVVEENLENNGKADPFDYIDLVAVGIYSDIMRLDVLENRYLIMEGMRNMKNTGLVRILKSGKANMLKINSNSIAFTISPMLNGVARMDRLKLAIDMLLEDDDKVCQKIQREMKEVNKYRKERQSAITKQYEKQIDTSKKVLIVVDEQESKGFNGIVAQQLSDRFKRPVIVARKHKGEISGSFRSYDNYPFRSFLKDFGDIKAVGHEPAGGVTVKIEKLEELENYIENNLPELSTKEQVIEYDFEIDVQEAKKYVKAVEQFNLLHGNGFPKINVRINNIAVDTVETLGATEETRKIQTFDNIELIRFRTNINYAEELECFHNISAVGLLQMNEWYNNGLKKTIRTVQVVLDDYKSHL